MAHSILMALFCLQFCFLRIMQLHVSHRRAMAVNHIWVLLIHHIYCNNEVKVNLASNVTDDEIRRCEVNSDLQVAVISRDCASRRWDARWRNKQCDSLKTVPGLCRPELQLMTAGRACDQETPQLAATYQPYHTAAHTVQLTSCSTDTGLLF